jgi:hypothetical protein
MEFVQRPDQTGTQLESANDPRLRSTDRMEPLLVATAPSLDG